MLPDELVQNGDSVQILRDNLIALRVQTIAPDKTIVPDDELVGKAILEHIVIIVYIVIGENQRLFALREVQRVADHDRLTVCVRALAPHIAYVHQNIAPVIDALQNFVILVHCYHPVIDSVRLGIAVKGQLGIGHNGVEKEVLHDTVPRRVGHAVHSAPINGGGGNDVGFRLRLRGSFRLRGFGRRFL